MDYNLVCKQLDSLISSDDEMISNYANSCALLNEYLENINWVGYYFLKNDDLYLGPFQGKVACTRLKKGIGVCQECVRVGETVIVDDVHSFKTHIACDSASKSEIVLPIHKNGIIIGVLDIDSPVLSRFTKEDKNGLEEFVKILEKVI